MILRTEALSVSYGQREVIKNISLEVDIGEIVAITGKNGSGKTTLCLALAGLLGQSAICCGRVLLEEKDISTLSRAQKSQLIGIIFQDPDTQLFSPTVEDELAFAPENLCLDRKEIQKRIEYALKICGIDNLRYRKINSLSGGEKQLVAIASVLAMRPKVLVADEITSSIERDSRERILRCIHEYSKEGAVLIVTHSAAEISLCSRKIILGGVSV